MELGFYIQGLIAHLFIDERLKDFHLLTIHHCVTIYLIMMSGFCGHHRHGVPILLLHDAVDVLLYSAKAISDAGYKSIARVIFFLFAASYFVLRIITFGYLLLVTVLQSLDRGHHWPSGDYFFQYKQEVNKPFEISALGVCFQGYCCSTFWSLNASLYILFIMHVYWFSLILKMIKNALTKGPLTEDIRKSE